MSSRVKELILRDILTFIKQSVKLAKQTNAYNDNKSFVVLNKKKTEK